MKKKWIPKQKTPFLFFQKPLKQAAIIFNVIGTLNEGPEYVTIALTGGDLFIMKIMSKL